MHCNLITVVNYKTRLALHADRAVSKSGGHPDRSIPETTRGKIEGPAEELLSYLLFADEGACRAADRWHIRLQPGVRCRGYA